MIKLHNRKPQIIREGVEKMIKTASMIERLFSEMTKLRNRFRLDLHVLFIVGLLVFVGLRFVLVFAAIDNYTVTYSIQNDWGSGATVNVTIQNNGASAIQGWKLAWMFEGNQKIDNLWNGKYTQSDATVTVEDAGYNAAIAANGGTVSFGFNLTYSGTNSKPSSFTLNGTSSDGSPTPTPTPAANQAPIVNAGVNQTVILPATLMLNGTASDDGLPSGSTFTTTWSKVSGPGTVTFANPNSPSTTATFSVAGTYVLQLTASDTALSSLDTVTITVNPATGSDSYVWNYGTVPSATIEAWNDNPTLTPININPYGRPSLTIPYGYILLSEGPNGTSQVSATTQTSILQRIHGDLKWETQTLGVHMPPWSTGKTGTKYIDYFFTNTGLPNDPGATGDQSWEGSYPFVESDSNGMSDQNRYNITHEFNHVLLNAYGTVPGNSVSWIQESLNNYMILRLAEWRNGATIGQSQQFAFPSGIGYLDATVYNQPYCPIESCGINSSGEATGPSDYMNDSTGFRYNDLFPLFVSQRVGLTFYAKVFEAANTSEQNLQTMTRLLDKARVQSMVTEYAARLALGDFMEFSTAIQGVASTSMYAVTTNQSGWLVPSNNNKLPRYTGRNFIPISVNAGATSVTINFAPDSTGSNGTTADMRCQIAYRATDGTTVFSTPVSNSTTTIQLTKAPKNGVVIAVISNVTMSGYKKVTSYGWDPTEKFGYKIQVTGGTAAVTSKLYF